MPGIWSEYEFQPSFVLGFHGCDKSTAERLLRGEEPHLMWSEKKYDWLGHGIYLWEGNPGRALQWANHRQQEGKIADPFVLGAIIDLKHCLDLFDGDGLQQVADGHRELIETFKKIGTPPPKNLGPTPDKAGRFLDCAVINYLHTYRELRGELPYDTIRAPFLEGRPLYTRAGFRKHNHIQLCVCEAACLKGYFRPIAGACGSV